MFIVHVRAVAYLLWLATVKPLDKKTLFMQKTVKDLRNS